MAGGTEFLLLLVPRWRRASLSSETCAVVPQVGFIASLKNELKHEIVSQVSVVLL